MSDDTYFFYKGSPFSQFMRCDFAIDGIQYCWAEQYMMAEKARLFKDDGMLQEIMNAKTPFMCKKFGRRVRGFDAATWDCNKFDIVVRGTHAKFSQNGYLKKLLFSNYL